MTRNEACKILGVFPDITESELKKRYRKLMSITHPDANAEHDYPYEATEINVAYEFLLKNSKENSEKKSKRKKPQMKWNAPINPNAAVEREVYQYYEDNEGCRMGIVTVDTGKYMWGPDEDFSLFLKSLYTAARQMIIEDDEKKGINRTSDMALLADITYLLSGQFFGADAALSLMKKEDGIYSAKALLESGQKRKLPEPGEAVVPLGVRNHRLYVGDKEGRELGYLSFPDDRLLFGIIPLFERKAVQVKMTVEKSKAGKKMTEIRLWLKPIPEDHISAVDSINLRIEALLNRE